MTRPAAKDSVLVGPDPALQAALGRLDVLIKQALQAVPSAYGRHAASDPYRGLRIRPEDAAHLLSREPGEPVFRLSGHPSHNGRGMEHDVPPRLRWLSEVYGLEPFDLDVILIALAPELDLRYQRLYAYLQDDVTCKHPTIDLVLNLLCPTREARHSCLGRFSTAAPLRDHAIIHLLPDATNRPLLARSIVLDPQFVALLLDFEGLDERLARVAQLEAPVVSQQAAHLESVEALDAAANHADPLLAYLHGSSARARRDVAGAFAVRRGMSLLAVEAAAVHRAAESFQETLRLILREVWLHDAVLFINGVDALTGAEHADTVLFDALAEARTITILAGDKPPRFDGSRVTRLVTVSVDVPDAAWRRVCWTDYMGEAGIVAESSTLDALAARFRLMPGQIAQAIATAQGYAAARSADVSGADLFAAAQAQTGYDLRDLAEPITPRATWDDIVLPGDARDQLRELCDRVDLREHVLDGWRFTERLSRGTGTSALFSGPSGTGKTMAAEIIAHTLGLALYRVDLSSIVSKYIGETEKNLNRIFAAAQNEILFFDEADALFGKRSEVRDSHDRYANIEISYLLQKMEAFEGVAILATNLQQNLDSAFMRRFAFVVHFPFPDSTSRRRIWDGIWPDAVPLAPDVDLDFMAAQFAISGGSIKNIALAAAFLARADESRVTMPHLLNATRREYQKIGKVLTATDVAPYSDRVSLDDQDGEHRPELRENS